MCSETSCPFFVSLIILIRPFFSKPTNPSSSSVWRIFTAWEYVQSTSFASWEPYFARVTLPRAINIIAGFLLKNRSKFSVMFSAILFCWKYMFQCIY